MRLSATLNDKIMDINKFEKILIKKMEELRPGAERYSCGLQLETGSWSKTTIRVHLMAHFNKPVDDDKTYYSEWYTKNSVAECLAEMDMKIHEYKKTEKLDLS